MKYNIKKKLYAFICLAIYTILLILIFGLIYKSLHDNDTDFINFNDTLDPYYYSFVSMFTVGFGDLIPKSRLGKLLTCLQILIFWASILIFNIYIFI